MTGPRYFEWDYTRGVVTEYERVGACQKCGECCRKPTVYVLTHPPIMGNGKNGGERTNGADVWQEVRIGEVRHFWRYFGLAEHQASCPSLCEDGTCICYDGERHAICSEWPFSPACLEHFPRCGYSFRVLSEESFA